MMMENSGDTHTAIESLRKQLKEKPKSALLHARLSCLLSENATTADNNNNLSKQISIQQEALSLAKRAIELRPDRPAGYAALSTAADATYAERMEALKTVMNLHDKNGEPPTITVALSLVRLLTEPRKEEARVLKDLINTKAATVISKTSPKHPSRRDLNDTELKLYKRIHDTLNIIEQPIMDNLNDSRKKKDRNQLASVEYNLGRFFRKLIPETIHRPNSMCHFKRATILLPSHHPLASEAKFWLATFSIDNPSTSNDETFSTTSIDRCPEEYVRGLYSTFAENFDELLVQKLGYETPTLLRQLVEDILPKEKRGTVWASRAADLGCGTGLSGIAFKSCIKNLIGVDLSPEMVEKAKQRDCYSHLVVGDVEDVLNRDDGSEGSDCMFDLIFACDVMVYIGDLRSVFKSARRSLNGPDSLFAFSTECLKEDFRSPFVLQPCARFAHKVSYIEDLVKEFDFSIELIKICPIRKNKGKDVEGILCVLGQSKS